MYLDPRGEVKVCCQNEWLRLGNVAERPLLEIWRGEELQRLRARVAEGDLRLGCEMCAVALDRGAGEVAYLNEFAHLPLGTGEWPVQLELALSSTCNLQCVMCNGELSSAIRVHREGRPRAVGPYDDRFFADLDAFLPHLHAVTFLGGEPLLAREPLRVMERLVELGLRPWCSVTTNGTQWTSRIERIAARLPLDVAVSIDGASAGLVESVRVGVDHRLLLGNVARMQRVLDDTGGRMRVAFCLMAETWSEMGELLAWADGRGIDVFVNTVHHPPQHSFAHCPIDELGRAVEGLRAEDDRWRAALDRNRQVWIDQVEALAALWDQRRMAGTPVEAPARRRPRAGAIELEADTRQLVTRVDPGDGPAHGIAVESLVGGPLWEVVRLVAAALGPLESSTVERRDDGSEVRRLRFRDGDGDGVVELTATLRVRADGGPTWTLELAADGAVPVSAPPTGSTPG